MRAGSGLGWGKGCGEGKRERERDRRRAYDRTLHAAPISKAKGKHNPFSKAWRLVTGWWGDLEPFMDRLHMPVQTGTFLK